MLSCLNSCESGVYVPEHKSKSLIECASRAQIDSLPGSRGDSSLPLPPFTTNRKVNSCVEMTTWNWGGNGDMRNKKRWYRISGRSPICQVAMCSQDLFHYTVSHGSGWNCRGRDFPPFLCLPTKKGLRCSLLPFKSFAHRGGIAQW